MRHTRHTKHLRYIQAAWVILLAALVLGLVVTPANAAGAAGGLTTQRQGSATSVGASIYITTGTLAPIFQSRINQRVPGAVNTAINNLVNTLPKQDRGWALQMATTLIQPSAALTGLSTQSGGLATSLRVSLYPGDPQPINASMLVTLAVLDSSTVQVSARPINGGVSLVNGPLATFQIPLGQLNSIYTTPTCGDSALAVKLQFPISLGHAQGQLQQNTALDAFASTNALNQPGRAGIRSTPASNTNSYVELPASSLASI